MNNYNTRLIATITIWVATAMIFLHGYFNKLDVRGEFPTFIWAVFGMALALSPAIATRAIWNAKLEETSKDCFLEKIPWGPICSAIAVVFALFFFVSLLLRMLT